MTEVEFHTGVVDRIEFACRLLRKAHRGGHRVLVTAPAELLVELDRRLWTFDERDFVPHVRVPGADAALRQRTPIWLAAERTAGGVDDVPQIVVNLGAPAPAQPASLDRLIEVVSSDPDDAAAGRERWRAYKSSGLQITHHAGSLNG